MSSITWTPAAREFSGIPLKGICWRLVELQSRISTSKITDTLEEQASVEAAIEETKFPVPRECQHLNFLLFTPFRYRPYRWPSRFRRLASTAGVFYCSEHLECAIAEMAFWRLIFYSHSPATPWPANPKEYTAFAVEYAVARAVDLTSEPFCSQRHLWTNPVDYTACLELADAAMISGIEAIRYESVRDPGSRANIALLSCRAFTQSVAVAQRTWTFSFNSTGVRAFCEFPFSRMAFYRHTFNADPRFANMTWDR